MIIKFQSEDSGDFVMLSHVAEPLLRMMGHSGKLEGSVSGDNLSSALTQLESALQHHTQPTTSEDEDDEEKELPVAFATRAVPLIEMLKKARANDGYVMWRPE